MLSSPPLLCGTPNLGWIKEKNARDPAASGGCKQLACTFLHRESKPGAPFSLVSSSCFVGKTRVSRCTGCHEAMGRMGLVTCSVSVSRLHAPTAERTPTAVRTWASSDVIYIYNIYLQFVHGAQRYLFNVLPVRTLGLQRAQRIDQKKNKHEELASILSREASHRQTFLHRWTCLQCHSLAWCRRPAP